jgi:NAD+ synthase (glutamine-hydrolysing)
MAQINPIVGDLEYNSKKILEYVRRAKKAGATLVALPELAVTGYPPEDLLLKPSFIDDNLSAMRHIARKITGITAIIGFVDREKDIYNAAGVMHDGHVAAVYRKMYLPNYGVFDEERYFQAGAHPLNVKLDGVCMGLGICEDIWYPEGPARAQALAGAEVILNINASPFHMGKARVREEMLATRAIDNEVIVCYNNMVGGQDELVFDGHGMVLSERGEVIGRGKAFEEDLIVVDLNLEGPERQRLHDPRRRKEARRADIKSVREVALTTTKPRATKRLPKPKGEIAVGPVEEVFAALKLGTQDYVRKNGFRHAVIGLSGGVDSALVAAIAVEAMGPDKITGIFMPTRYSSKESSEDAKQLAKNLGIEFVTIPIDDVFETYLKTLKKHFKGKRPDTTEENLQARIRGNVVMAFSNKFGHLVLTTGNKSEMGVGYATLYGDMAGGFAVIKDVHKLLVYKLCELVNRAAGKNVIPKRVLTKAPSAELRFDQTDQDTLPPYEELDPILRAYIEEDRGVDEISSLGFGHEVVRGVIEMVDKSEYKRRQSPPGIKITERAFGKDRRMPITNGYVNK